ncbi:hypothetical protein EXIGLDRAFT_730332 [Exidia glandulosa HHB12029]|uniref:Uncharacterized protein n=1 Tax=Exidia glandulosa HHB12029 TaxID=1314781 RepID=A0A165C7Q0_EXIGL|nr:hypothetical protein EXIGLDRAFT_730332 [Exidia glandulosa HHB12029]
MDVLPAAPIREPAGRGNDGNEPSPELNKLRKLRISVSRRTSRAVSIIRRIFM